MLKMITDSPSETAVSPNQTVRHPIVEWLDARINLLLQDLRKLEGWQAITDPGTDPRLVKRLMQEIYLDIVGYQPHVIEAAIAAIAQMPRSMDPKMVRAMLFHQADEFDHGEMALRDYLGDQTRPPSLR